MGFYEAGLRRVRMWRRIQSGPPAVRSNVAMGDRNRSFLDDHLPDLRNKWSGAGNDWRELSHGRR